MGNPWWLRSVAVSLDVGRFGVRSVRGAAKLVSGGAISKSKEGDFHDFLKPMIGDRRYEKLSEDVELALEEIHYCQQAVDDVRIIARADEDGQETESPAQGEQTVKMKDLINHDYLILKLRPGDPNAEVLHIKAHKDEDGIHIQHIPSSVVTSVFHEGVRCLTVACSKKRIRLETVVAILKQESPDYHPLFANCWYYAQKTAKRLMKACIETPEISSAEKARLQNEHDNLEPNLIYKHFKNVMEAIFRG